MEVCLTEISEWPTMYANNKLINNNLKKLLTMRKLFYLFSAIVLAISFTGCSNDDNDWFYGDKQNLPGTEWECSVLIRGNIPEDLEIDIPKVKETFRFDGNNVSYTANRLVYDPANQTITGETTTTEQGTYEYKHPNLTININGMVIEAEISARNRIYFWGVNGYQEFIKK